MAEMSLAPCVSRCVLAGPIWGRASPPLVVSPVLGSRYNGRSRFPSTIPTVVSVASLGAASLIFSASKRKSKSRRQRRDHDFNTVVWATAPAVDSRESCCFDIKTVEGKGLGAIATRDIAAGELIIAEKPVLLLEYDRGLLSIQDQFDALPAETQQEFMSLFDVKLVAATKTVQGIVETNSIGCVSMTYEGVVCLTLSRFNHSCLPNCEQFWDEAVGKEKLFASTDIKSGEELCFSYVPPFLTREERMEEFTDKYRFECKCRACFQVDPASDTRRTDLFQLLQSIEEVGIYDDVERAEKTSMGILEVLDGEGLFMNGFRVQACYYAFQCLLRAGRVERAQPWIDKACGYCGMCRGSDNDMTMELRRYAKDPKTHPIAQDANPLSNLAGMVSRGVSQWLD